MIINIFWTHRKGQAIDLLALPWLKFPFLLLLFQFAFWPQNLPHRRHPCLLCPGNLFLALRHSQKRAAPSALQAGSPPLPPSSASCCCPLPSAPLRSRAVTDPLRPSPGTLTFLARVARGRESEQATDAGVREQGRDGERVGWSTFLSASL